jgi:hypothetical protein
MSALTVIKAPHITWPVDLFLHCWMDKRLIAKKSLKIPAGSRTPAIKHETSIADIRIWLTSHTSVAQPVTCVITLNSHTPWGFSRKKFTSSTQFIHLCDTQTPRHIIKSKQRWWLTLSVAKYVSIFFNNLHCQRYPNNKKKKNTSKLPRTPHTGKRMRFYSKKCWAQWINSVPTEDMQNLLPARINAQGTPFFKMAEKLRGRETRNWLRCYGSSHLYISVELFCLNTHAMSTEHNHQTNY